MKTFLLMLTYVAAVLFGAYMTHMDITRACVLIKPITLFNGETIICRVLE